MPYSANLKLPRFMMHFSYAGQAYAGVQMNTSAKIDSVQSVIERALYNFQSTKYPLRFGVSSRTDRGVHALHNTATFDWIAPIDITTLVQPLNTYLAEKNEQIRILRIHSISPHFHFRRHCLGRKYVYRLGFLTEDEFTKINSDIPFLKQKHRYRLRDMTPAMNNLFEKDFITYIEPPYDLNAFRKGIEVFQGQHNFSAFTTSQGRINMARERRCPIKTMQLNFNEGEHLIPLMKCSPLHSSIHIYNLVFEAEAFLYKLIRRITGTLIHIAKGQMTIQDVLDRFACPPDHYDSQLPITLKPNGLFLHEVKYNEQDFLNPPIFKGDDSTVDDIDNIMMEIQEDDDEEEENDEEFNSKMMTAR
ncbi:unnamed protein product [Rotaria sordida]|uniref:tRNA pseudouridine synthase n=1 Tax=Rotaria sordida TaxID=392033 RepID=A0A819H526_9BILA|nr:unnamed protein product [Rotaria sordida]CAF1300966.1 unnamed protein product [Rotaria sordida]CAF1301159.1 unnamed protein product [Rotaria sordida]CAF1349180.1 unnamed protein product [Rotaria sordida]CAF1574192.1 unnamed protein product [Rotaria sordida]